MYTYPSLIFERTEIFQRNELYLYQSILNFNLSALYLFTHIYFVGGSTNYYGKQLPMSNFFFQNHTR